MASSGAGASRPSLIIAKICPFAHRSWLAATEAGADIEVRDASLTEKPEWLTSTYRRALGADPSSDGKVPVLVDGDFTLAESAVVADYILGKWAPALGPSTPELRARTQIFLEQVVSKVIKHWYGVLSAQEEAAQATQAADFIAAISAAAAALNRTSGGPFAGEHFTLADMLLWPWIARLAVLAHYRKVAIPDTAEFAPFHAWVAAMRARPAVAATQMPDEFYIAGYLIYANGTRVPK